MSVRTLKVYIWLVNILILVGILGVTYLFFTRTLQSAESTSRDLKTLVRDSEKGVKGPEIKNESLDAYNSISKCPLFMHPSREPSEAEKSAQQATSPLDSKFELRCVVSDSVVVLYKGSTRYRRPTAGEYFDSREEVVFLNKPVPNITPPARLISTRPAKIPAEATFRYDGKDVIVKMKEFEITGLVDPKERDLKEREKGYPGPAGQVSRKRRAPVGPGSQKGRTGKSGGDSWQLSQEELDQLKDKDQAREIRSQISLESNYDSQEKKSKGVKVKHIDPGSIFEQKGLESGDIILSINNTPVSSEAEIYDFVKKNWDRYSTYYVKVLREGQIITLTYRR